MNRIVVIPFLLVTSLVSAQFLMFPGDTNNDGVANYLDILPIGLGYNTPGIPREIPNINWIPQEFIPWGQILPFSGVEYGFIDCNGNGFIDSLDLDIIALNYDQMQVQANPPPMPYELPDTLFTTNVPGLNISFNVDTAYVTDTFFVQINLDYPGPGMPESALGIAFGLEYNADLVKDSLTVILPNTVPDDLMFITAASNFLDIYRLPAEGRIEIGAAGRGQNAINGPRNLATVQFIVEDVIIRSVEKEFVFTFTDVLLINDQERVLEVGTFSDTIILVDTSSVFVEEVNLENEIEVFPNPSVNEITVKSGIYFLKEIQIFNQLGQEVRYQKITSQNVVHIFKENLPGGIYFLKIQTDKGILTKKICFF